jgi:hypothetical protein
MNAGTLVALEDGDDRLVDDAYGRVFRPAFDTTELPDMTGVQPADGRLVLVLVVDGEVMAGAVFDRIPSSDIGLLSYMATRAEGRGRGWGAKVLSGLRARWNADSVGLVLGEVRDPRAWSTSDAERPADRLRFYSRNDCRLVPVPWVQPALGTGPREAGLLLIAVHGAERGTVIEASRLAAWAAAYYRDAEGEEPSDAQYRALIERLDEHDVETLPIEDYESVRPL